MITAEACGSFCNRNATSSRMRLQTLSTRGEPAGANKHSLSLLAIGGGGGAFTVTATEQSAAPPLPSSTRPVTVYAPAAAPVVSRSTVEPVPTICPPLVCHVYVSVSPSGELPLPVICTFSPINTTLRSAEHVRTGGCFGLATT